MYTERLTLSIVCVCVCVCERERECVCVSVCVCVYTFESSKCDLGIDISTIVSHAGNVEEVL